MNDSLFRAFSAYALVATLVVLPLASGCESKRERALARISEQPLILQSDRSLVASGPYAARRAAIQWDAELDLLSEYSSQTDPSLRINLLYAILLTEKIGIFDHWKIHQPNPDELHLVSWLLRVPDSGISHEYRARLEAQQERVEASKE